MIKIKEEKISKEETSKQSISQYERTTRSQRTPQKDFDPTNKNTGNALRLKISH